MLEKVQRRRSQICLIAWRHTGHDFHILGGLILHDVHGVIEGDDSYHPVVSIHNRNGQQIIFTHHPGDFFLVCMSCYRDQIASAFHHTFNRLHVAGRQKKAFNRYCADQQPVLQHIAGINCLLVHPGTPDAKNGVPHRHIGIETYIFRRHYRPG